MQHIFLLGLSGSGKSTVGRLLAQFLGRSLLDLDTLIEEECNLDIPSIFAQLGESYFRDCESRILARAVASSEASIIVTGGGVIAREENRALISANGLSLYLRVPPELALARMQKQFEDARNQGEKPELRPLLSGPDPLANLQNLLAQRSTWYETAELSCDTQDKSPQEVALYLFTTMLGSGKITAEPPIVRHLNVGQGYDAIVDWGGLGRLPTYLQDLKLPPRLFLITDSNLEKLYLPTLTHQLASAGFELHTMTVPAGEKSKSFAQLQAIYDWLLENKAERKEALIAFGGGVVGDLVGYAAASYLRGVPLIQIPTSLLAQVDSAIGGKTGINHPRGKNLIGAFYHPRLVLADPAILSTLPRRERTEGWAEIVKYGIIQDAELFSLLETHAEKLRAFSPPPTALVSQIIARCISLKAEVVEQDEREQELRAILNYGHTVGHALEKTAGYGELFHGEAVSLGMVVAASLAEAEGLFSSTEVARQNALLVALDLPTSYQGSARLDAILQTIQVDKKVQGKRVRWVLPTRIGSVKITQVPDELVQETLITFLKGKTL